MRYCLTQGVMLLCHSFPSILSNPGSFCKVELRGELLVSYFGCCCWCQGPRVRYLTRLLCPGILCLFFVITLHSYSLNPLPCSRSHTCNKCKMTGRAKHHGTPSSSFLSLDHQHHHSPLTDMEMVGSHFFLLQNFWCGCPSKWASVTSPSISTVVPFYSHSHWCRVSEVSGKKNHHIVVTEELSFPFSFPRLPFSKPPNERKKKKGRAKMYLMHAYFLSAYSTSDICTPSLIRSFLKVAIGVNFLAPAPAYKEVVFCRVQQGPLAETPAPSSLLRSRDLWWLSTYPKLHHIPLL